MARGGIYSGGIASGGIRSGGIASGGVLVGGRRRKPRHCMRLRKAHPRRCLKYMSGKKHPKRKRGGFGFSDLKNKLATYLSSPQVVDFAKKVGRSAVEALGLCPQKEQPKLKKGRGGDLPYHFEPYMLAGSGMKKRRRQPRRGGDGYGIFGSALSKDPEAMENFREVYKKWKANPNSMTYTDLVDAADDIGLKDLDRWLNKRKKGKLARKVKKPCVKGGAYGTSMYFGSGKNGKKAAARSPWIQYVKMYAARKGLSYKDALSMAGPSYRKSKGGSVTMY
jgi:hypothetical protein